jgi:hypothetical protein
MSLNRYALHLTLPTIFTETRENRNFLHGSLVTTNQTPTTLYIIPYLPITPPPTSNADTMQTNLAPTVNLEPPPDRLRQDLLDRLHWDIFGPLEAIQVRDPDGLLTPFLNHPIASESLAHPPLATISVYIDSCLDKAALDEHDEDEGRYHAPEPLVICKRDVAPISLCEFVTRVHRYLNDNRDELYKCEDEAYFDPPAPEDDGQDAVGVVAAYDDDASEPDYESMELIHFLRSGNIPAGSRFLFDYVLFNEVDTGEYDVSVGVFVEGQIGISLETFLARKVGV